MILFPYVVNMSGFLSVEYSLSLYTKTNVDTLSYPSKTNLGLVLYNIVSEIQGAIKAKEP